MLASTRCGPMSVSPSQVRDLGDRL